MYAGQRAGIPITRAQALRWITVNPAWALGLDSIVGTLEPGKMADVVVWSGDPFSVYSKAAQVYNDGWLTYDRADPAHQPRTDFELGQMPAPGRDRRSPCSLPRPSPSRVERWIPSPGRR